MVQEPITNTSPQKPAQHGQALVEYALILVLVVMALVAAVAATGPALGNVFSNTVFNLVGITGTPQNLIARGGPAAFWATMTYVADHPPTARVFPQSPPKPSTATATQGPSPTPTLITPSKTPQPTATLAPTSTAEDFAFDVPYVDSIDQPVWWRVDSSVYLGGADWLGEYFPNKTLTAPAYDVLYNQEIDPTDRFNLNFDWGSGSPLTSWLTNGFSIRFTRKIDIQPGTVPVKLNFTLSADDGSRLIIDGAVVINNWSGSATTTYSKTFTPDATQTTPHTVVVEYFENTGNAKVSLSIGTDKGNIEADANKTAGVSPNCPWSQTTGTQPNTLMYSWKENLSTVSNGFPTNMRCNLELRGYVDINGAANPTMSFWDVWDFGTATDTSVQLILAEYAPYVYTPNANPALPATVSGGPNWTGGTTYTLHSAGKNYAWTRNELTIPATLLNKKVTWRFVMESGTATSIRRWYLDDIQLAAGKAAKTFGVCSVNKYTCGSFWSLDVPDQKVDFITSGRWDLTNKLVASNDSGGPSLSWDISSTLLNNSATYSKFGTDTGAGNRTHYVAFNGLIDLTTIKVDGTLGQPDWEGDSGFPILSFYEAYGLEAGDSIEVQYTRDSDTPGAPANWTRVGLNAIKSVASNGTPISDEMNKYEVQLKDIPSWNTTPFRLRFALIVDNNKESTGWYIDNIAIEREGILRYGEYPFCDDSERADGTAQWIMGGQWGIATTTGAFTTGRSFSDSPNGNYVNGQVTSMTMRYPVDFNNDTPENLTNWGGNKSCLDGSTQTLGAKQPILSFWHWRKLGNAKSFRIEVYRAAHNTGVPATSTAAIAPTAVWTYNYNAGNSTQVVWEREEVDMRAAIEKAVGGGVKWATLAGNADKYDDDFYVQITFDASSGNSVSDGIFIDNIVMQDYSESSFKLWSQGVNYTAKTGAPAAGLGNGTNWVDDIDNPNDWYSRWSSGSPWTAVTWDSHSGITSMHNNDTSGQKYLHQSFNVLEMTKILDLRGAKTTDLPTLFFWNHYNIASGDSISVDVAVQDETEYTAATPTRNLMGYDLMYQWGSAASYAGTASSWESIWSEGANSRNDAWVREQVDLKTYAGKRIKVRFVLNAYSDSSVGLGWWLDDVQFTFRTNEVITLPFSDDASNMRYWIPEGKWGLAPDQWRGSGGGAADIGTNPWSVFWFDCIDWTKNPTKTSAQFISSYLNQTSCNESTWGTFFDKVPRTKADTDAWIDTRTASGKLVAGLHFIKDFRDVIDYDFGSDGRPGFADDTWYDYYGARFLRTINVTGGQYTFITTSDDGVRVRVETSTGAVPTGLPSTYWNVISNWTQHSSAVNYQNIGLVAGTYQIIMEYFEATGGATAQLQVGTNKFSFSDSPKAGVTSTFPVVNSIPYSDSSMIFNGVLNLNIPAGYTAAQWKPRLEFYTLLYFNSGTYSSVEVSTDGGFTWGQSNLSDNCPAILNSWQCNPTITGAADVRPASGYTWQQISHDLTAYTNKSIGLRFKLHTGSSTKDGWWITDLYIANNGS